MEYLTQTVLRYDGTLYRSRRKPKLHIRKPDGTLHACTGVAHAAEVLSRELGGEPITAGHVTRRSQRLRKRMVLSDVHLAWQSEVWPTMEEAPSAAAQSSPLRSVALDGS